MAGEIFNPNPIVFSTSKTSGRKLDASAHSLWIDDANKPDDETDEVEAIDQDEIFGTACLDPIPAKLTLTVVSLEQISFARYTTQNIRTPLKSCVLFQHRRSPSEQIM